MTIGHCPSEQHLVAFLVGGLDEGEAAAVAAHLEICDDCEAKAGRLDRLPTTLEAALHRASPTTTEAFDFPAGERQPPPEVAGYLGLAELGRGGMGVVYRARQVRPSRLVALKMLQGVQAGTAVARFAAEVEAVAGLKHPNIVQVYEVGEHDGRPFFSMELVEGGSLDREVREGPIPPRRAARLAMAIAHAVHHAHERGVVHRDLKPANVLLAAPSDPSGEPVPMVTDFGIAKRLDADLGPTRDGEILGTPAYMSPEQAGGGPERVGPAADVYSLGVILYELLTGRVPFRGPDALRTILLARTEEPVPPRRLDPKIPRDLETACLKCLAKDPARRYDSAAALAEDLRRYLEDEPIAARPASAPERAWKWARRRPTAAASLGLGLLAASSLLVGGAIYNARLRSALDRALVAERSAGSSARDASRQRDLALSALRSLVFEVQQTLRDEPATREMRRKLLDRAIAGLRDLARGAGDASPDLGRLTAHREMGDIFLQLGETAEARLQYEACEQVAAQLLAVGQLEANTQLAPVERRLGDIDLNANRLVEAEGHYRRALEAAEAQLRVDPRSPRGRLDLIEAHMDQAKAKTWARRGEAAVPDLLLARDLARQAAADNPDQRIFPMSLAGALVDLADQAGTAARFDEARDYYDQAIAVAQKLVEADGRDREAADMLLVALNNQGELASERDDLDTAGRFLDRVATLAEAQAEADPEAIRTQLRAAEVEGNLANLARRRGQLDRAEARAGTALGRLERLESAGKLRDLPVFRDDRMPMLRRIVAYCRAVPVALGDDGLARILGAGHPPRLTAELLAARLVDRARQGDDPAAAEAAEALARIDSDDGNELYELAANASEAAGRLAGTGGGPPSPAASRAVDLCGRTAVARLARLVDQGFRDRDKVARDPRFRAVADWPDFQALIARITKPAG